MIRLSTLRLATLAATITLCSGLLTAQTYSPQLFSPKRTGDSYWFKDVRTVTTSTIVTQSGNITKSQRSTFQTLFEADATVITNNATGKATQERFKVATFTVSEDNGPERELLAPGTVFYGKLKLGEKEFTDADGKPLSSDASKYLAQIIGLRDNSITDDDIFAPEQPVSIGESWPVNPELASEDFNFDRSLQTDPRYLKGTVTLSDISTIDGKPYYNLTSQIDINRVQLPRQNDIKLMQGNLSFVSEITLPQEPPYLPLEQHTTLSVTFIGDPAKQNKFTPSRIMIKTTVEAQVSALPLPRDESVTELDRTLGIRR